MKLPALIDRATARLQKARSSAEVLEIKHSAEAALHYANLTGAANETHADCLRIIARAELRLADEIDKGQRAGDVATRGRPQNVRKDNFPAKMSEAGIDRRRLHEWRDLRNAGGMKVVEEVIAAAAEKKRAPSQDDVLQAVRRIKNESRDVALASRPTKWPDGKYGLIYADPPWRMENPPIGQSDRSVENHYPTMSLDEICALPVSRIAHDSAVLFLWATSPKLAECFNVITSWGFDYRTCMVWGKDRIGMGWQVREKHEILLIAKRGELPPPRPEDRPASLIIAPRGKHSEKPEIFYGLLERMYPALPKVELFSRTPRKGWAQWGYEAETV